MASIFDDLVDPYSLKLPRRRGTDEMLGIPKRDRLMAFPSGQAASPITGPATRPRVVPDLPPPPTRPTLSPVQQARNEYNELMNATPVNNDTGFGGRLLDVIRQAVIGAGTAYNNASGTPEDRLYAAIGGAASGGLQGGFDPAVDERRKLEYDRARAYQNVGEAERQAQYDLANDYKLSQIRNTEEDNSRMRDDLDRKKEADRQKVKYWAGILEDKKLGRELSATKIDDLRNYRNFLMEQGAQMNAAKIRQIDERLKDYDLDRESRERIAADRNATTFGVAGMQGANRIGIEAIKAGAANTKSKAQAAARITAIREGGAKRGASPEEIEQRVQEYINNLPPEVRP